LGFAIQRQDHIEDERYWMSGMKTFKETERRASKRTQWLGHTGRSCRNPPWAIGRLLRKSYRNLTNLLRLSALAPLYFAYYSINSRKPPEAYPWPAPSALVGWLRVETDVQQDCAMGHVEHVVSSRVTSCQSLQGSWQVECRCSLR
jgi:hypothetical protein